MNSEFVFYAFFVFCLLLLKDCGRDKDMKNRLELEGPDLEKTVLNHMRYKHARDN